MKCYPTDIVNYLVASDEKVEIVIVQQEDECSSDVGDIENIYPVPQRELDNSIDDGRLSHNYDRLATKHQHIPQCYSFLMKAVSRLSDGDALFLMMDKCNYFPNWTALSCRENIQWNLTDEELQKLLLKFFCGVKEVHLNIVAEPDDKKCSDVDLTACFASPSISSLYLHLLCEVHHLNLTSEISRLSLKKLHISSPFDFTDTVVKELTEILQHHCNVCELEVGEMSECNFPDDSKFLSSVSAIICNPQFNKFSFEGCEISPAAVAQLLFSFFPPSPLILKNYS